MRFSAFIFTLLLVINSAFAGDATTNQSQAEEDETKDLVESPGGSAVNGSNQAETPEHKSGYSEKPKFGSTFSVPSQLEEDDRVKKPVIRVPSADRVIKPWFDKKRELNEFLGFKLGMDYNTMYQSTSDSLTEEDSFWSGIARVYGTWTVFNKGEKAKGSLVWSLEHRHNIHYPLPPADAAGQMGYAGLTGTNFNDAGALLGSLYWQQYFGDGNGGIIAGRFDPNDFMDVLGYFNPYTTFSNLAVGSNWSIALHDWSWGIGAGRWLTDQVYLLGTINDANGSATNEKFFEGGSEFFSQAEIGWSPSKDERYFTNVHLTIWHVDERKDLGIESSKGIAFGANKTWNETWMAFAHAGWSEGSTPIYNQTYTIGFGRLIRQWSDVLGVGINWGESPDKSLPDQTTVELFYRMQLSEQWQLTPSLQYIKDPALNDESDSAWVFGLRMRLTL